jgi:periplasmic divalent cation tolerance protein
MKSYRNISLVMVTAPDMKSARKLAKAALQARVAACVNLVSRVESHYWWQGEIEQSDEVLLLIKTTKSQLAALEASILNNHPYHTPEFVSLPLSEVNERYGQWLLESIANSK